MVVTNRTYIPTDAELTVEDVPLGTPYLRAGAIHLGKACEAQNNEFMLCRMETMDPTKCVDDGKGVTACTMDFFKRVKGACATEFTTYAMCLEKSSPNMDFKFCRKTQAAFDACMEDKLAMPRPHYGYHCLVKVHDTNRPKPEETKPAYLDDPRGKRPGELPEDFPKQQKRYGLFNSILG